MVTAIVTSKGQITIPKAVRDELGLHTGDRVEFVVQGREGAVMKPMTRTVDEVFGCLRRPGEPARSVEDMDRAIGERMRERFRGRKR
jgi:AbrB family looped-hinge helix DNA binding protein